MSRRNPLARTRRSAGFTLIETLVAVVLVAIGLVGVFGGIAAINRTDSRAREAELLQRLALEKINEIGVIVDPTAADTDGDFEDRGYPEITWTLDIQPSGAENISRVTVTTTRENAEQTLTTLLFVPPDTTANTGAVGP
ncbi:MAG: prepilin-type N-terminal cleavage/methylation domain-containing protein [Capsulimonadales bacterium]|nr:prepilin-type N-terminal cleavage/methylation domain-containing protein [Capsulimonadales bacterium]